MREGAKGEGSGSNRCDSAVRSIFTKAKIVDTGQSHGGWCMKIEFIAADLSLEVVHELNDIAATLPCQVMYAGKPLISSSSEFKQFCTTPLSSVEL